MSWFAKKEKRLEGYFEMPGKFPSDKILCFEVGNITMKQIRISKRRKRKVLAGSSALVSDRFLCVETANPGGKIWSVYLGNSHTIKSKKISKSAGILEVYLEHD